MKKNFVVGRSEEITKVIFRKWRNGEILAIFPEDLGTESPYTCNSYAHVGQHGACDPRIVFETKLAKPHEYAGLKAELERIGYRLQIQQRIQRNALEVRRAKLDEIRGKQ